KRIVEIEFGGGLAETGQRLAGGRVRDAGLEQGRGGGGLPLVGQDQRHARPQPRGVGLFGEKAPTEIEGGFDLARLDRDRQRLGAERGRQVWVALQQRQARGPHAEFALHVEEGGEVG